MNYAATAQKAAAMLAKAGAPMALRITTPGTDYDAIKGRSTGETVTDFPCVGVLTNPRLGQRDAFLEGSMVEAGDKVVLLQGTVKQRPEPGHELVIQGDHWTIISLQAVEPGGVAVLYKVHVRHG